MATLQQIGDALKRAAAAGDHAAATKLAQAYKAMQAQSGPPPGAVPGSREYADWAASQARAGKTLPQVSPPPPGPMQQSPNLYDASMATVNGLTGSIPGLQQASDAMLAGGQTVGDVATGQPIDFGARFNAIQGQRKAIVDKAPLANTLGSIGGTMALTGGLGALPGGAEALGMAGGVGKQLVNSALSTAGYEGLQGLAHGHMGGQLLADEGIGAGSGLIGSVVGQTVNKLGQSVADKITNAAQKRLTTAAIDGAPSASDLFSAGSQLFDKATGGNPLQVTDTAYFRMLGDIQNATQKFRPNQALNPEAVGLLQQLYQVGDELSAGTGVAVDFKDLHILRQSAQAVTQKGTADKSTKAIASIIVNKIDNFISGLKPGDIAGGADPTEAANSLMRGISTWRTASKVAMIEQAIKDADTYKSGTEMGLKASFTKLMKSSDYARLSPIEQQAVREVAKGTTVQNAMALLGRAGFSLGGGGGHNIIGGTLGAGLGTAALTPVLGPLAPIASLGLSMGTAGAGRAVADKIATTGANRAAQIMATNGIPVARQLPNLLAPVAGPAGLLTRAALPLMAGARR